MFLGWTLIASGLVLHWLPRIELAARIHAHPGWNTPREDAQ